jgi:hypothetical protein
MTEVYVRQLGPMRNLNKEVKKLEELTESSESSFLSFCSSATALN